MVTLLHVLNFSIPIGFMVFFGFWLDRMCKPAKQEQQASED